MARHAGPSQGEEGGCAGSSARSSGDLSILCARTRRRRNSSAAAGEWLGATGQRVGSSRRLAPAVLVVVAPLGYSRGVAILLFLSPNMLGAILRLPLDRVAAAVIVLADVFSSSLGRAAGTLADAVRHAGRSSRKSWRILGRALAHAPAPQLITSGHAPEYNRIYSGGYAAVCAPARPRRL